LESSSDRGHNKTVGLADQAKVIPLLVDLLMPSLAPCPAFASTCLGEAKWDPSRGFVPRGWLTTAQAIADVQLVLVTAEPGDPADGDDYSAMTAEQTRTATETFALDALERDILRRKGFSAPFHRNLRLLIDLCWPEMTVREQISRTWITPTVLCSARTSGGTVKQAIEAECMSRYLVPQLDALRGAFIIALGGKAERRLRRAGHPADFVVLHPSCREQRTVQVQSWRDAANAFHSSPRFANLGAHLKLV
jgi:hypothetical protein